MGHPILPRNLMAAIYNKEQNIGTMRRKPNLPNED